MRARRRPCWGYFVKLFPKSRKSSHTQHTVILNLYFGHLAWILGWNSSRTGPITLAVLNTVLVAVQLQCCRLSNLSFSPRTKWIVFSVHCTSEQNLIVLKLKNCSVLVVQIQTKKPQLNLVFTYSSKERCRAIVPSSPLFWPPACFFSCPYSTSDWLWPWHFFSNPNHLTLTLTKQWAPANQGNTGQVIANIFRTIGVSE